MQLLHTEHQGDCTNFGVLWEASIGRCEGLKARETSRLSEPISCTSHSTTKTGKMQPWPQQPGSGYNRYSEETVLKTWGIRWAAAFLAYGLASMVPQLSPHSRTTTFQPRFTVAGRLCELHAFCLRIGVRGVQDRRWPEQQVIYSGCSCLHQETLREKHAWEAVETKLVLLHLSADSAVFGQLIGN